MKGTGLVTVAILAASSFGVSSASGQPTWVIHQLTSGSVSDRTPRVSGTTYVWRRGNSSFGDIYMWTEGDPTPVQISTNIRSTLPAISGPRVVWQQEAGGVFDIEQWEGGAATALTNDAFDNQTPDISGMDVVWRQGSNQLVLDDGTTQTGITAGVAGLDTYPRVAGGRVVWEASTDGSSHGREIFHWSGGTVTQLTTNSFGDFRPQTDGVTVVWYAESGPSGTGEIWRWRESDGAIPLTNNSSYDFGPDVSGDAVVFARDDGNDFEIFLKHLGTEYQITDNDVNDSEPAIDGDRLVWQSSTMSGDLHIYYAILDGIGDGSPVGACCTGLMCSQENEADCALSGGLFIGPETFCTIDSCPDAVKPATTWSTAHHDARRSGQGTGTVPVQLTELWTVNIGSVSDSIPVTIGPNGNLYSRGTDGPHAIGSDGQVVWEPPFNILPLAPATIRADGHFFQTYAGNLIHKVSHEDGGILCNLFTASMESAPAIGDAGHLYFLDDFDIVKADPSCGEIWTHIGSAELESHLAIGPDGGLYATGPGHLLKVNPTDGTEAWDYTFSEGTAGQPAIATDGTIVFHRAPDLLTAINPDGTEKWTLPLADARLVSFAPPPAIASDGTIYFVTEADPPPRHPTLVAVSAAGSELWRVAEPNGFDAFAPAVDAAGNIVFGVQDGDVMLLAATDGMELGRYTPPSGDWVNTTPAIGVDNRLYATTDQGLVVAIGCFDNDGDLACDEDDLDDDNDGVADIDDIAMFDPDICGDSDGDTCDDCAVGTDGFGPMSDTNPLDDGRDGDGDGLCDAGDACPLDDPNDSDSDGVCESDDACPGFDDSLDADGDTVPDDCDNCVEHSNLDQADCDKDDVGDVCAIASGASNDFNSNNIPDECEPCSDSLACADLDDNVVRDSNCVWWECVELACSGVSLIQFADMGGAFGVCQPDTFANIHDKNHALSCFAGTNPCDAINIDAGGPFGECPPDGFCNIHDANHALAAFAGTSTCSCPPGPAPEFGPIIVEEAYIAVEASSRTTTPGSTVHARVFADGILDALRSYQLEVEVTGGTAGTLNLIDIAVEHRKDDVFANRDDTFDAFNMQGRMLRGLEANDGVRAKRGYLATFIFEASKEARGQFVIDVAVGEGVQTFLVAPDEGQIEVIKSRAAVVTISDRR
jgi:hypothetical protein